MSIFNDNDSDPDYHPGSTTPESEDYRLLPTEIHSIVREIISGIIHDAIEQVNNAKPNVEKIKEQPRGRSRKRKLTIAKERAEAGRTKRKLHHQLLDGCTLHKCPKKCQALFSHEKRKEINETFWNLEWVDRQNFIRQHVTKRACKQRVVMSENKRKSASFNFTFRSDKGEYHPVCKRFFLNTLGLKEKSDKIVRWTFRTIDADKNDMPSTPEDKRGRHQPKHKIDHALVYDHVETYNPSISHYRREHAPNRRYLPLDITIKDMWESFNTKHNMKVTQTFFGNAFREMNISIARLGNEECEVCDIFKKHQENCNCEIVCNEFSKFIQHRRKYRNARQAYKADSSATPKHEHPVFAADMQKVLLLPMMDQFKKNIFTPRLCVFNETFSQIGTQEENKQKKIKKPWRYCNVMA